MTVELNTGWAHRAQALADTPEESGDLHDPAWKSAVAAIPRHMLVPEVYEQSPRWRMAGVGCHFAWWS